MHCTNTKASKIVVTRSIHGRHLRRLASDETTGGLLATFCDTLDDGGRLIHFKLDDVNVLAGVGKGVIGIKLDEGDSCIGGCVVGSSRFDKMTVETESGKTQEFGRVATKLQDRGGKGDKPGQRTNFTRVVPPPIELVNWDEVEGKPSKASRNGTAE